ncbi:hypothetical protein SAMN02746009_01800 [Hymenobacter psychrotolerans DSM 18569]|uniref:Uncharacterized protein n=2 Tax=Hymenobacter psychrotolerans TaxID=344998 RepID=A0A1M6WIL4_9BACT|nr:hypothetical protein SAMN02746009_01800 [Hymenobacter psychrotolerans DSM 18569]
MGATALLSSVLTLFAGCTAQEPEELPTPVSALSVGAARTWYETTQVPQPGAASAAQSDTSSSQLWSLNWARAIALPGSQPLVLVPLRGDARLFAGKPVQGTRYLVVGQEQNATTPTGLLVELLLQRTAAPLDTAALFASLYRSYRAGQPVAPANGSGLLLFYTPSYRYLAGRRFENGSLLAGNVRLAFRERNAATAAARTVSATVPATPVSNYDAPSACIDWYQDHGDGTYTYITTTGDCTSTSHGSGDGSGGPYGGTGDGGWGGDAGGSGGDGDGQCRGCDDGSSNMVIGDIPEVNAIVIQTTPTLGNYGATLRVMDGLAQVVEVRVEVDTNGKDLKKVVVDVAGVVWFTKLTQQGDGTLTRYDPVNDTYYFQVSITKTYGDIFSNTRTLYGQISPSRGVGIIYFP